MSEPSLRSRVVEAGARAVRQLVFDILMNEFGMDDQDPDDQEWGAEQTDAWMEHWFATGAGRQLDAMLSCLSENGDDWLDEIAELDSIVWPPEGWTEERARQISNNSLWWALAVLREDR